MNERDIEKLHIQISAEPHRAENKLKGEIGKVFWEHVKPGQYATTILKIEPSIATARTAHP